VDDDQPRLIELTAAVSLATDVGTGQPMEHALRTSLLAVRAADALGATPDEQSAVLYAALLRFLGCTAEASETAALAGGDDIAFNALMAPMAMADDREAAPFVIRHLGEDLPFPRRIGRVASALADPGGKARTLAAHCEVGARLAARIGLPAAVTDALAHAYERWDGKGSPAGIAGADIPMPMRIAIVARDVELSSARGSLTAGEAALARRRGTAYDPEVVDLFASHAHAWLDEIDQSDAWCAVVEADDTLGPRQIDSIDEVLLAFADFADLKSSWLRGHSRGVAELAGAAATACGLDDRMVARTRRAGLVHDLGVVGVPSGVLDRAGPLGSEAWERVRLHTYVAERILTRCRGLSELASDVGRHHERVDGSGYHRGTIEVPLTAQLIAAADVYRALCEDRAHRPRVDPAAAAAVLADQADEGKLGRAAVDAVLAAAGHTRRPPNIERPAGLTEREVDVLRLIARGRSNKQMGAELGISPKTIGTHVEHIYAKAGVATRAGATLFALENDLVAPDS